MDGIWISYPLVIAVGGLLIKEGASMFIKYKANKNGNGKNNIKGLLEDIRSQGNLTLTKVGSIEHEQGEIKIALKGITTEMVSFKEKHISLDKDVTNLDQRLFDHVKKGG